MRPDEAFVADSLVAFHGGPSVVSASDGEDPPDLYLSFTGSCIGVEVTRLSQFTIEPNGIFGNRATQDSFGLRLLDEIDSKLGPSLPNDIGFLVGIELPVPNAARFRKGLIDWVADVARNSLADVQYDRLIEGSKASIAVIPARQIKAARCFERVFLVSRSGLVSELSIECNIGDEENLSMN